MRETLEKHIDGLLHWMVGLGAVLFVLSFAAGYIAGRLA